jgi:hypothetical protein
VDSAIFPSKCSKAVSLVAYSLIEKQTGFLWPLRAVSDGQRIFEAIGYLEIFQETRVDIENNILNITNKYSSIVTVDHFFANSPWIASGVRAHNLGRSRIMGISHRLNSFSWL